MKRTLLSFLLFSAFSFSSLYSEDTSTIDPVELFSMEDSNELDEEISSLEEEISSSEIPATLAGAESSLPELSKAKAPSSQSSNALFSSLEDPSPISLANNELIDSTAPGADLQTVADPFIEDLSIDEEELTSTPESKSETQISLTQVFLASPLIYSFLLSLSLFAIAICLYSISRLKFQGNISESYKADLQAKLQEHRFEEVLAFCKDKQGLLYQLVASAVGSQKHGWQAMIDNMKAEGKRATISSWQRLSLLQDVAIIAPMLGLLGTVLGMFYAFYDLNRSFESIGNLFDGFGIAVGTTVAGIIVAILSMTLHSIIKFRLIQSLARVESEATALVRILDENTQSMVK